MRKRILVACLLSLFVLFIFAGGALAAKKYSAPPLLRLDGAEPPGQYFGPSPILYESGRQPDCEDIHPPVPPIEVIQHGQWAMTYYDYQKNGSMGRMIAVSSAGHRHMICHETRGDYTEPQFPRYIRYNCKDPLDEWCGATGSDGGTWLDGGTGINAGYAQMLLLHDGAEIILYHRQGSPPWHSTLLRGDAGTQCECTIVKMYDIPDEIEGGVSATPNGYWPKGCIVHDVEADPDTEYIHIINTESTGGTGEQATGYQRCFFDDEGNLVCCTPPPVDDCYVCPVGVGMGMFDRPIATIDVVMTIATVIVSSPVSKKVAIVYTQSKDEFATQINNDVVYIESQDNGNEWFLPAGIPAPTNITNYTGSELAYTDVAACYDYNDSLHIVWNVGYYDEVTGDFSVQQAKLYHWRKTSEGTGISMIASEWVEEGTAPGGWNRNISKMSISAKDPIYHPGGDPDSVYLFCTWTQFAPGDMSLAGWSNGDIYAAVSNTGGESWAPGYNLTNTQTPDCAPGVCLSEHWSSLAENMFNGDLHIEYVCDRDAGGIVQGEGSWTDNPMMYLHLAQFPCTSACGVSHRLIDPADWCLPPLKVPQGGIRNVKMELQGIYNKPGGYVVSCSHPNVTPGTNSSGTLAPGEKKEVTLIISCPPEPEQRFISANADSSIIIHSCIGTDNEDYDSVMLHAVCSDIDYYECMRDERTWIEKDNCKIGIWICCNTMQYAWDKRLPDANKDVIFNSGVIVATTFDDGQKVVGRQDRSLTLTGTRDTIRVVESSIEDTVHYDEPCIIQKVFCSKTFICPHIFAPPKHLKWFWIAIFKEIIMFHDLPPYECPNWKKEQIIKHIWIEYGSLPLWWPDQSQRYQAHNDIYLGVFADLDAPFDEGCNGCNTAGYENGVDEQIMWQHGWYNDSLVDPPGHPEFEDYYVGMALTDRDGNPVVPYGAQNVLNEEYLYPQEGWGWLEDSLYNLAATEGVNVHYPDSIDDRTVVLTAGMIPEERNLADIDLEFILIEAFIKGETGTGLYELVYHIQRTRDELIPELRDLGVFKKEFPLCGDATEDGVVNIADVVYLVSYLFTGGPPPSWPFMRGDATGDCIVNIADVVYLVSYLFTGGPPPTDCCGWGRQP